MKTTKESIYFDVREYNAKLARDQRRIKADNESITGTMTFAVGNLPEQFKQNGQIDALACKLYTSKDAAAHNQQNDRVAVKFKIGASCRWFNKHGQPTQRPTNADLENKHFDAVLDYNRKEKTDNALAPSGYWVNAIMFAEREDNPFADCAIEPIGAAPKPQPEAAMPADQPQAANLGADGENDNLPF